MNTLTIVLGILLFAVAAAIIYAWGLDKSLNQREDLERSLKSACGSRIVKQLKKQETINEQEAAALIEGMTVGPFWSRNKVKVNDGKKYAGSVLQFLVEQQYIEPVSGGRYQLKK